MRVRRGLRRLQASATPARIGLCVGLVVALACVMTPGEARSQDSCPEPNDTFQLACFIGTVPELSGALGGPNDVDAYRLHVLSAGARLTIDSADSRYALLLYDWNGGVIAQSNAGESTLEATVSMPGAYYLGVSAASPDADLSAPYRVGIATAYPDAVTPTVLFSEEFRSVSVDDWAYTSPHAIYSMEGLRFSIDVREDGIAHEWERVASRPFGPAVGDFTATFDSRATNQHPGESHVGYRIGFRWRSPFEQYSVVVDVTSGRAWLNLVNGDSMKATVPLSEPDRVRSIARDGGVNRTTIRAVGNEIRISINGAEGISVQDPTFGSGRFNFVAAGWAKAKPLARFDNVLITTPSVP